MLALYSATLRLNKVCVSIYESKVCVSIYESKVCVSIYEST